MTARRILVIRRARRLSTACGRTTLQTTLLALATAWSWPAWVCVSGLGAVTAAIPLMAG